MHHLKQLSQYEWFVSRTETPYRKCQFHNAKAGGTGLRITRSQAYTSAENGTKM